MNENMAMGYRFSTLQFRKHFPELENFTKAVLFSIENWQKMLASSFNF